MDNVAAVLMMLMGIAIAGVWTREILAGDKVDLSHGFFAARDPDAGTLFWPYWLAEYATATALIVAAVGLLVHANWAAALSGLATGALIYTSVNSLAWALSQRERYGYAAPMLAGVAVGLYVAVHLVTR